MIDILNNVKLIEVKNIKDNKIEGQQAIDLTSQSRLRAMWDHKYRLKASASAQNVFLCIYSRTFSLGKVKAIISHKDMAKGTYSEDGELIIDGIGISPRMIQRGLKELEELNYIIKTRRVDEYNGILASIFEINIKFFNNEIKLANKLRK